MNVCAARDSPGQRTPWPRSREGLGEEDARGQSPSPEEPCAGGGEVAYLVNLQRVDGRRPLFYSRSRSGRLWVMLAANPGGACGGGI